MAIINAPQNQHGPQSQPQANVIENLYAGGTFSRFVAWNIDITVVSVLAMFILNIRDKMHIAQESGLPLMIQWSELALSNSLAVMLTILFLKFKSATPGKVVMRLQVIDFKTKLPKLSWYQAIVRGIVGYLGSFMSIIPTFALFRSDRRQLADILAGTRVVGFLPRSEAPKKQIVPGALAILGMLAFAAYSYSRAQSGVSTVHFSSEGVSIEMKMRVEAPSQTPGP